MVTFTVFLPEDFAHELWEVLGIVADSRRSLGRTAAVPILNMKIP